MVASTMAYSMSGSSETASKSRLKTSAFTHQRNRANTVFHLPNIAGRSRQGLPVLAIHNTASRNNRPSPPVRPGSLALPRQCGSIFAHWASVKLKRSMTNSFGELESRSVQCVNPESRQTLVEAALLQLGGPIDGLDLHLEDLASPLDG